MSAWIIANNANASLMAVPDLNPFYQMLPEQLRVFAVILSAFAAIIASQALITGSYSIVSEAVRLDLEPEGVRRVGHHATPSRTIVCPWPPPMQSVATP